MEKPYTHRLSRTAAMLMAAAAAMPLATTVYAAPGGIAQRELARRMALVSDADRALHAGREAYAQQDFETAVAEYRRALELLPKAPSTENRRQEYVAHLSDASVALSQHYRRVGKRDEARGLVEAVTTEDPTNAAALQQLEYLDDPIRTNPALSYGHTKNVDEVRRLLYTAQGYFDLGDFDKAEATYLDVLRVDKYNKAARRGMERLEAVKREYYLTAYDHTRAALLAQVDQAWELAVPSNDVPLTATNEPVIERPGASIILSKLKTIRLKSVNLEDVTVEEAIDYLRQQSRVLDTATPDPLQRGINFDIQKSSTTAAAGADGGLGLGDDSDPGALRISEVKLRNVPILFVLKTITEKAKLKYKVGEFAVTIAPRGGVGDDGDLFNRTFRVPPDFQVLLDAGGGEGADADPFAAADGGGSALRTRKPVKDLLEAQGVAFPPGSSAVIVGGGSLVVNNTPAALDQIETIVDSINAGGPKQIMISTKFVEIAQENTDELGFDWLITPFGLGGGESLFLGGGTTGSGAQRGTNNFITSVNGRSVNSTAGTQGTNVNSGILTAGTRSGEFAIDSNSIDAVLNNPNRTAQSSSVAPGILSLTGLFTDGQVQLIMRGLQQRRGTDIMTAPSVLARNAQTATIEIIREFIYPTEYEPPELPNQVGIGGGFNNGGGGGIFGGGGGGGQSAGIFPVTPATPTAFETRNTGVTLEIEPTVGSNNYTIDLTFVPEIVEFEGFVNYGSPIQSPGTDALGNSAPVTITDNRIEQPVFSSRRVNTGLTIYDGHTVAVGGLMREDVQNVQDSVPILGDIPVIGRLFQTKAENRIKSNLIIFVTARIIDPTGRPLNGPDNGSSPLGSDSLPELPQ